MLFMPVRCSPCRRSLLVGVDDVVDGAGSCRQCGGRAALIAGHSYDWLGAQYYREIEGSLSRSSVSPAAAAELAMVLTRARGSEPELQAALRSAVRAVPSAAVVRAGATGHPLSREVLGILMVLLHAVAAELDD